VSDGLTLNPTQEAGRGTQCAFFDWAIACTRAHDATLDDDGDDERAACAPFLLKCR